MRTILEVITLSTDYLTKCNINRARRQAEELVSQVLAMSRMDLYLDFNRPLTEKELDTLRAWLKRRGSGEPLQYIAGHVDFASCRIGVAPGVLIPRQETEILVDKIGSVLAKHDLEGKALWDVCCGSGAIGIALKKRFPNLNVALSDISPDALAIAKKNAAENGVEVEIVHGDLLVPFKGRKADFIVCNPPYIREDEFDGLDPEVRCYEPKTALVSGSTGLEFYARLAESLPHFLNRGSKVWFEIGTEQGEAVKQLFGNSCWTRCSYEQDWSGHDRFFSLEIE